MKGFCTYDAVNALRNLIEGREQLLLQISE